MKHKKKPICECIIEEWTYRVRYSYKGDSTAGTL